MAAADPGPQTKTQTKLSARADPQAGLQSRIDDGSLIDAERI